MKYSELYYQKRYVNKNIDPRSAEEILRDGALAGDPVCQYHAISFTKSSSNMMVSGLYDAIVLNASLTYFLKPSS